MWGFMTLTADTDAAIYFYATVVFLPENRRYCVASDCSGASGGPMKVEATRLCLRLEPTRHLQIVVRQVG